MFKENSLEMFEIIDKIGEGSFGKVFKARHKISKKIYALKKIKIEDTNEGFPASTIREVTVLKELNHLNVVRLWNIIIYKMKIVLVFEFCEEDLHDFLNARACTLTLLEIKQLLYQLLKGIEYMHDHNFMHRDLKPQNLLLTDIDPSIFSPKGSCFHQFHVY